MNKSDLVITNVDAHTPDGVRQNWWVAAQGGLITSMGPSGSEPEAQTVVEGGGLILSPGLIDVHCHGGGGGGIVPGNSEGTLAGIQTALEYHASMGTTRLVISTVSMSPENTLQAITDVDAAMGSHPGLVGLHLEGPFLNNEKAGAHDPKSLRNPSGAEIEAIIDAAGPTGVQITMAPELPGAPEAIATLVSHGWRVAVGHTLADATHTREAFSAGATGITHAFNAMPPISGRNPGPLGAAVAAPQVFLEVIADGHHVDPEAINLLFHTFTDRLMLVSDAISMAVQADGPALLGNIEIEIRNSVARTATGSLASSTHTVSQGIRNVIESCSISPEQALKAATSAPARYLGNQHRWGSLGTGFVADFVLWNKDFTPARVWRDGQQIITQKS